MARDRRRLIIEIVGDASSADRAFGRAGRSAERLSGRLRRVTGGFGAMKAAITAAAGVAAGRGLGEIVNAASDLGEQINKTAVVFGNSSKAVHSWARQTASAIGISNRAALEAAGTFGNMLVPMGLARQEAARMSMRMVDLSADMASFNNANPEETLDALRAGLAGETEPLRRFGVFLNDARIKQEALNLGLWNGQGELKASAKAQATYSLILKDTKDAQGDFAATSDSLANRQRILKAQVEDTAAKLGQYLLPAVQTALGWVLQFVTWIDSNVPKLAPVWNAVSGAFDNLRVAAGNAWPYIQSVAGDVVNWYQTTLAPTITSVIGTLKRLWRSFGDEIKSVVVAAFGTAKNVIRSALDTIKAVVNTALAVLSGDWGKAWDGLKTIAGGMLSTLKALVWDTLTNIGPRAAELALALGTAISRKVGEGIKAVSWGMVELVTDRIITPLANLSEQVFAKGQMIARQIGAGIRDTAGAAWESVKSVFKGFINSIITVINHLPGVEIDKLAEGDIVRGPRFALIGEDGPEAVIPLSAKRRRRGQELLTQAARILGVPGDFPGPRLAQNGSIIALAEGAIIGGGRARSETLSLFDRLQAIESDGGLFGRIVDTLRAGLGFLIGKLPGIPSVSGDLAPIVQGVGKAVLSVARNLVGGWFTRAVALAPMKVMEAKEWAESQMGKPYVWGGGHAGWNYELPGYDCSGFASHAAKKAGADLAGPGTTMSLFPISHAGSNVVTWGFRGMSSSDPRRQHMGIRILGSWYQFGDPGRKGGDDSQWDSLRIPPGLPGYADGISYVPETGPAILHKSEAVLNPSEAAAYRAGRSAPVMHVEHMHVHAPMDVEVMKAQLGRLLAARAA